MIFSCLYGDLCGRPGPVMLLSWLTVIVAVLGSAMDKVVAVVRSRSQPNSETGTYRKKLSFVVLAIAG
ncbi:hypothetical protein MJO52_12605 [Microbulbifer variabilis]|uniref:Uncharacterized protein n=2 Tax=Microbulbifer TaxID=48073 RepID=A0ABY4V6L8_9GAMM|nr:hypothetical protein [Microbulbifer variabilis]USD19918.1 hypothetical protein MJO52_12605 [Microbulbifer variabilis]